MIREGLKEDAAFIGKTITEAMGRDLCIGLAEGEENLDKVLKLFTDLASTETAQYSYKNTLIAINSEGEKIGAIIGYDGASHREMRKDFIAKANELLGWNVTVEEADTWEPETNADEIYLDSLYVIPAHRNQGVATSLIKAAIEKHKGLGKPFGLLVEPHNSNAHKLYKKLGFKEDGINNFCGEPMLHLSFTPDNHISLSEIWEKMLNGEEYDATHPGLRDLLMETRMKLWEFNSLKPDRTDEMNTILKSLFGKIGEKFIINQPFRCDYGINIFLGEDCFINFNCTILDEAKVKIGDNAFIGPNVNIYTACHPIEPERRNLFIEWAQPVNIGNNVWIGGNVTILPGVTIGDNVTIGAGSVVTKSFPSNVVIAGNPAKVIKKVVKDF